MNMRTHAIASGLLLAGWLAPAAAGTVAPAPSFEINLTSQITSFDGSGTGSVPLAVTTGVDPFPYKYLDVEVTVSESPLHDSMLTASLAFDGSQFTVSSTLSLYLDLTLTDADADADFAPGLGSGGVLALTATSPITATLNGTVDLTEFLAALPAPPTEADLLAAFAAATTYTTGGSDAVYDLGVDVNGDGSDNVFNLGIDDIDIDPSTLAFTIVGLDPLALISDILLGTIVSPLNLGFGLEITGATLTLGGSVNPPFTLDFTNLGITSAPRTSVPEPATLLLLGIGLGLVGLYARRRARAPVRLLLDGRSQR